MLASTWSDTNIQFNTMAMTWPHCKSAFVWNKSNLKWKYWNITWPDITCFAEAAVVIKKGGGLDEFYEWQKRQDQEKRRKMVKVVCQVKGIKYSEEHYKSNSMISVSDVRLVLKEMGVDIFIDDVEVTM
jgi:hypothetical protein